MATRPQHRIKTDETEIVIKPREDHFTLYWTIEGYAEEDILLDICEDNSVSSDAELILYTDESERNETIEFQEAKDRLERETPQFVRVNTDDFGLLSKDSPMRHGIK